MPLNSTLREAIDRVEWGTLTHAYGGAGNTPAALELLTSDDPEQRKEGHGFLFSSVYHQGTVYSATVEVVPILTSMVATDGFPDRHVLLGALSLMYNASSYHESGMSISTSTQEYQQKFRHELRRIRRHIRESLPAHLSLLTAPEWKTRLHVPELLCSLKEEYGSIGPVAVAAFETETHPLCRAGLLVLLSVAGEPIRPRWDGGLKNDPALLMRVVAAARVVHQERENTPQEVIDVLLQVMAAPPQGLAKEYRQLPPHANLTVDISSALSLAGPATVERMIDNLLTSLQSGPDAHLHRTSLLLHLTCVLAGKRPVFSDPSTLSLVAQRVARECHRQLGLEISPRIHAQ